MLQRVAQRLKTAREAARLTIAAVAENTDLSKGNISSWENAKFFPGAWALVQLSELYGVSIDWILTGSTSTIINMDALPAINKKVEAITDPDLKEMVDVLTEMLESDQQHLRSWAILQFQNAYRDYLAMRDAQKKLHA